MDRWRVTAVTPESVAARHVETGGSAAWERSQMERALATGALSTSLGGFESVVVAGGHGPRRRTRVVAFGDDGRRYERVYGHEDGQVGAASGNVRESGVARRLHPELRSALDEALAVVLRERCGTVERSEWACGSSPTGHTLLVTTPTETGRHVRRAVRVPEGVGAVRSLRVPLAHEPTALVDVHQFLDELLVALVFLQVSLHPLREFVVEFDRDWHARGIDRRRLIAHHQFPATGRIRRGDGHTTGRPAHVHVGDQARSSPSEPLAGDGFPPVGNPNR
jgi:hypothetical protein